jgi:hypothetical protein
MEQQDLISFSRFANIFLALIYIFSSVSRPQDIITMPQVCWLASHSTANRRTEF